MCNMELLNKAAVRSDTFYSLIVKLYGKLSQACKTANNTASSTFSSTPLWLVVMVTLDTR